MVFNHPTTRPRDAVMLLPSLLSPWLPAALRPPPPPVTAAAAAAAAAAAEGGLLRRPQSRHRSNLLAGWVGLGWVASGDGDTDEEIPKHPSLRSAARQLVLPRDGSMTQKRGFSEFAKSQGPSFLHSWWFPEYDFFPSFIFREKKKSSNSQS